MNKWKWLCAVSAFSVSMVACTMREAETPAEAQDQGRVERQSPTVRTPSLAPGISTLSADSDRMQFDTHLTDQLAAIDARIRRDTRLYEAGGQADRDRMSDRWQIALNKRAAIDENRRIVDMALGQDWLAPKSDIVMNLTILEQALDDVELVFGK